MKDPNRILFLDIDGPLIPHRAYDMPGQTRPYVTKFDPCAVGIINKACRKQGRKIVLHSSWIRTKFMTRDDLLGQDVKEHCIAQGIEAELFHEDAYCDRDTSWRYDRVLLWLNAHPEVRDFVIVDDEAPDPLWHFTKQVLLVDFENGLTMKDYYKLLDGTWRVT